MDVRPGPYLRTYDRGAYMRLIDAQLGVLTKLYRHALQHWDLDMALEVHGRIDQQLDQRHKLATR